jgi:three-Cys-motif partner protein
MSLEDFFETSKDCSKVKTEIVRKYFWTWAKVILGTTNKNSDIAYIDLYSGPGTYDDGTKSTPIQILENALRDETMKSKLVTIFNDVNKSHVNSLQKAIQRVPGIDKLKYKPIVNNERVGQSVVDTLKSYSLVPTLLFIDPWGYKGLSLDLIHSVLKDWGCDCIFFFNYRRINAAINYDKFKEHINNIFGKARADHLRKTVGSLDSGQREDVIMNSLKESLREIRGKYVVSFKFYDDNGTRTSHYIIFVSKHILGYKLMKDIMAPLSSKIIQGISFFEFSPVRFVVVETPQLLLFQEDFFPIQGPFDIFKQDLLDSFAGQTRSMQQIFEEHNINTNYIETNYKSALLALEEEGKIKTNPEANKRSSYRGRKTFGATVMVTFPH